MKASLSAQKSGRALYFFSVVFLLVSLAFSQSIPLQARSSKNARTEATVSSDKSGENELSSEEQNTQSSTNSESVLPKESSGSKSRDDSTLDLLSTEEDQSNEISETKSEETIVEESSRVKEALCLSLSFV